MKADKIITKKLAKRRLVVISNRLPCTISKVKGGYKASPASGGLVTALTPILSALGGMWLGWHGSSVAFKEDINPWVKKTLQLPFDIRVVNLSESDVQKYYYGCTNRSIWPLFHDMAGKCQFERSNWLTYRSVNKKFAQSFLESSRSGDICWIHDYHLMLVPYFLRQARPKLSINFFLHIPFPHHDLFRHLPWREEVINSLLCCNLIGFQIEAHAYSFLRCVQQLIPQAKVDFENKEIQYQTRRAKVGAFPISIDFDKFNNAAASNKIEKMVKRLKSNLPNRVLILGVDRLDYTKGVKERLLAMDEFLRHYPKWHGKVSLIQIAVPSRTKVYEYRLIKRELDELVGRINGRYAKVGWIPIHYLYRSFPFEELVTYYRASDISLVTPLKDGMNLIAKEYVASRIHEDGVLILSEFAGAARELKGALFVNPFNIYDICDKIKLALEMPRAKQKRVMQQMRAWVKEHDVFHWVNNVFGAMTSSYK